MKPLNEEFNEEFEGEETAVCDTYAAVMADIYKAVFLQEVAKIKFGPVPEDAAVTEADCKRVWEAAGRAKCVAHFGLEGYQECMRLLAEQND